MIGICSITGTESREALGDFSCDIGPVWGVNDLYLVFRGGSGYLFNNQQFRFEK